MSIQRCPVPHCKGSILADGDRASCILCGHVSHDRVTFSELFTRAVPAVLAYQEMTARGSHSRRFPSEAQTDGLIERVL